MADPKQRDAQVASGGNTIVIDTAAVNAAASGLPQTQVGVGWMNPGIPITGVLNPEPDSRRFDYAMSINVNYTPKVGEGIPFSMLRGFSKSYDLLRIAIEHRKDEVEAHDWEIIPRERADADAGRYLEECKAATRFFEQPSTEYDWNDWLRVILEDLFVCDGACIVPRMTKGNDLYSVDIVDVATIKKLLDDRGMTPVAPDPAYQQIIKGIPATTFDATQMLYWMRNPASDRIYGFSPVEWIITTVQMALRRQLSTLSYFTEGNMPDALLSVPETWNIDQIRSFQDYWDDMLAGQVGNRRRMKFVPVDASKMREIKTPDLKTDFEDWLARLVCWAMGVSAAALTKDGNRAQAKTNQESAQEAGLMPTLKFIKRKIDYILQRVCGFQQLQFAWKMKEDTDPLVKAQIHQIYVAIKALTPDEVREDLGKQPMTPEERTAAFPAPPMMVPGEDPSKPGQNAPQGAGDPANAKDPADDAEARAEAAKGVHVHVNVEAPVIKMPPAQIIMK